MINTIVAKIETKKINKKIIEKAVKIMKGGGLIIYPTETCYGIGCDVLNAKAVNKIYIIKKRDKTQSPINIKANMHTYTDSHWHRVYQPVD